MKTWRGRLERRDLGTGVWVLHTDDGTLSLVGVIPPALEGQRIEVMGHEVEGMGIGMLGGAIVEVSRAKAL